MPLPGAGLPPRVLRRSRSCIEYAAASKHARKHQSELTPSVAAASRTTKKLIKVQDAAPPGSVVAAAAASSTQHPS
jgi:hypothetical protein